MEVFENLYQQFLDFFPNFLHPFISIALVVLMVYSAFQTIKRNFIFLIILIILLPASLPILKEVLETLLAVIKFLLP